MDEADFEFAPGVRAGFVGPRSIVDAFRREYAPLEVQGRQGRTLEVRFGRDPVPATTGAAVGFRGRHKSVAWRISVSSAAAADLSVSVDLSGLPRGFARSLVQGYVVEPMLSVVSAAQGLVLVPSAGVAAEGGLILILGRSGAGKSTLMARLAAAGHDVLGDDQLFIDDASRCSAFPRRLRFYPDIETTAPEAFSRLPADLRRRLRLRGLVAAATRGYVRPSMGVDRSAIGGRWVPGPLPIGRIVLLERGDHVGDVRGDPATVADAAAWAARLLREQRSRLDVAGDPAWRARLATTTAREQEILATAFAGPSIERLLVPRDRPASEAVAAVAEALGFAI